ncbi:ABC transporter permease [uncultured Muribaculum sp.]|uniref:cell division protein FtsX n=1 Tax=uncultured Muribaculum sp. TaxID=1918613 RepID=UPI0025ED36E2|nr:permease-like cell division protein FtsX [uncultured Muribaculum sp.]
MKQQGRKGISIFTSRLTATLSVAMVLLLLGLIALLGIGAHTVTTGIRSSVGFDVVLADSIRPAEVETVRKALVAAPYALDVTYRSSDDAMFQWRRDTGEDLMEVLGVNPFNGEIEVKVKPEYAVTDSLAAIVKPVARMSGVKKVTVNARMIDEVNRNLRALFIVLGSVALVLLVISLALINNTVHLDIYSRRFLIHTMTLVGATGSFIRRPFLVSNAVSGLIAGVISGAVLAGALAAFRSGDPMLAGLVSWQSAAWVFPAMVLTGVLICFVAAAFSTNRYLRASYDDMFR